jgi:hypothetical protein
MQQGTGRRRFAVRVMVVAAGLAEPSRAQAATVPVFVLKSRDATLRVIGLATQTVARHISVGHSPHSVWALSHVARR